MTQLVLSFLAGVLTVLAPCIFVLLPVILGGSAGEKNIKTPFIIIASLATSVFIFSLLLKGTTIFLSIPQSFWTFLSGGILFFYGLIMVFPNLWSWINITFGLHKAKSLMHMSGDWKSTKSAILLGASLGPVFTTCSPTYALILAVILPANFFFGILHLLAYVIGLALILLLIAFGGQSVVKKLKFAVNPNGWFKRSLGIVLLFTGAVIITGFDKMLESAILDAGYLGPIQIEENIKSFFSRFFSLNGWDLH